MSDVIDLSFLSGQITALTRELALMRLQLDQLVGNQNRTDQRMAGIEQSFHGLIGEVAKGFGQIDQRFTRQERRIEALDAGLTALRDGIAEQTAQILAAVKASAIVTTSDNK
jgi:uncharacterized coiled-coil protein SlyX